MLSEQPARALSHPGIRAALVLIALAACRPVTDDAATTDPADTVAQADATPLATTAAQADRLIRADGIGHVRGGMTIGDLRAALPPGVVLGGPVPFMVDIDGIPVISDTDTLYYVLTSDDSFADDAAIGWVATENAAFRTAEGVGPGTALADAAAIYGEPTLSYSVDNESREFAAFPNLPSAIQLRVTPGSDSSVFAGIYTEGEYATSRYAPSARILFAMVYLGR
jgi:hypothetical protein